VTAAERRAILGDAVIDRIHAEADAAIAEYPPTDELLSQLRPILTAPANRRPATAERQAA
jgi:hypothetical protein